MIRILIAEPSYLLQKGLTQVIKQLQEAVQIEIVGASAGLADALRNFAPDVLIINMVMEPPDTVNGTLKVIHIFNTPLPPDMGNSRISIYDSKQAIMDKLAVFIGDSNNECEDADGADVNTEELTQREKLILKHVALGLTNKEIAAKLFISIHTVISHRKNITRKLDIKSVSGLTVYAMLNGIVSTGEVS